MRQSCGLTRAASAGLAGSGERSAGDVVKRGGRLVDARLICDCLIGSDVLGTFADNGRITKDYCSETFGSIPKVSETPIDHSIISTLFFKPISDINLR